MEYYTHSTDINNITNLEKMRNVFDRFLWAKKLITTFLKHIFVDPGGENSVNFKLWLFDPAEL